MKTEEEKLTLFTWSLVCLACFLLNWIIAGFSFWTALFLIAAGVLFVLSEMYKGDVNIRELFDNILAYLKTSLMVFPMVALIVLTMGLSIKSAVSKPRVPASTQTETVTTALHAPPTTAATTMTTAEQTTTITTISATTTAMAEDDELYGPVLPKELNHDSIVKFVTEVAEYNIPGDTKLKAVMYEDRNINMIVDATNLGEGSKFPAYMLADTFVPNLADSVLEYSELRPYWDTITVEFIPFRAVTFSKDQMQTFMLEGQTFSYFDFPDEYFDPV